MQPIRNIIYCFLIFFAYSASSQPTNKSYNAHNSLSYYSGQDVDTVNHKLNLLVPKNVKRASLFIWIGGGAWSYVNRDMEMDFARRIVDKGIAVASVGHRLSPATWKDPLLNTGISHPEHIKDIARAIAFLHSNADKYGYSRELIFVGGFSSGAHLASLIVMDGKYLEAERLTKDLIKGVIPVAGTYDVEHYHEVLTEGNGKKFADNHVGSVFGLTKPDFADASPVSYLDSLSAPMLLISETNTFRYTRLFEDRLREKNYRQLEVYHVHRMTHSQLWKDLSYSSESICRDMIVDFIQRNSTSPSGNP